MPKIAVIGGGISGLTAAFHLRRSGAHPVVFEHGPRLGGAVRTFRHQGWLLEAGPDSLLRTKPAAVDLAQELGVELVPTSSSGPPGIVRGGQVVPLPDGLRLMTPTRLLPFVRSPVMSWTGKLRALCEVLVPRRHRDDDESVASFVSRRFGFEMMEVLAQPLVGGIYAADLSRLSLRATLPMFESMERQRGSVTAGMLASLRHAPVSAGALFLAPRHGMGALIEALAKETPEADLRRELPVRRVFLKGETWTLESEAGSERFDGILFACSSRVAAALLSKLVPEVQQALGQTAHVSTATVHLKLNEDQLTQSLTGSGFVVPHLEGSEITACTYAHKKFPERAPKGKALLRVHLGNAMNQEVLKCDDFQLIERAVNQIRPILGLRGEPQESFVARHHKVLPQYGVGHCQRVVRAKTALARHRGLAMAGNGLTGVGLSDCILAARTAATSLLGALR